MIALAWRPRRPGGLEVRLDVHAHEGGPTVVGMLLQPAPFAGDATAWGTAALRAALDRAVRSQRGEARYQCERASRLVRRALRTRRALAAQGAPRETGRSGCSSSR